MAHIYDIGTRAWQPDTTEGWVASEVSEKQIDGDKVKLVFQLENGEVRSSSSKDTWERRSTSSALLQQQMQRR